MAQIWATIFFLSLASPVTRYHDQLSSCTTSEKTSNPIMKKRSDGWMYRRKRVISLEHITFFLFFFIWVFFHVHSRITGLQGKGEGISLTPHYHFHSLHRHLDISWAITAESSPLHIPSSRTRTRNL